MKMIKLTGCLGLAISFLIGASIESANAWTFPGRGKSYAQSSNVPDFSFNLVGKTQDGSLIEDLDANSASSNFVRAIESLRYFDDCIFSSDNCNELGISPDEDGNFNVDIRFSLNAANLLTKLDGDKITYSIFSPNSFNIEIIEDSELQPPIIIPAGDIYTVELDVSGLSADLKNSYVNDLQFITENNLLFQGNPNFVESTFGFKVALSNLQDNQDDCVGDETLDKDGGVCVANIPDTSIPEPSNSVSLLLLGITSLTFLCKRHLI